MYETKGRLSLIKLLIGGSPCTHWSIAQTKNREIKPEGLGWELFKNYLTALDIFQPDYFLYENNKSMSPAIRAQITQELSVEPIMINSALVSAQNRQRLYWVGKREPDGTYSTVPVEQPKDYGILLRDILESGMCWREKSYCITATEYSLRKHIRTQIAESIRIGTVENTAKNKKNDSQGYRVYSPDGKSVNICGQGGGMGAKTGLYAVPVEMSAEDNTVIEDEHGKQFPIYKVKDNLVTIKGKNYPINLSDGLYTVRKLTVAECKRLQTVLDEYVFPVSDTQAYKMLGNGWTVDVIAHILSYLDIADTPPHVDVLSMYDGMSCGQIALNKLGYKIERYRASETDKYCIKTTQYNFPNTIQIGDAFDIERTLRLNE